MAGSARSRAKWHVEIGRASVLEIWRAQARWPTKDRRDAREFGRDDPEHAKHLNGIASLALS